MVMTVIKHLRFYRFSTISFIKILVYRPHRFGFKFGYVKLIVQTRERQTHRKFIRDPEDLYLDPRISLLNLLKVKIISLFLSLYMYNEFLMIFLFISIVLISISIRNFNFVFYRMDTFINCVAIV